MARNGSAPKDALLSIDAVATSAEVARAIAAQGADWLLSVWADQPTLRAEVEAAFGEAGCRIETHGRPREGPALERTARP